MTGEDFEKYRNAVEVKRTEKPKTLKQQFSKYAQEVYNFQYHFDRGRKVQFNLRYRLTVCVLL